MATSSTFSTDNQYIKYRIVVTENSYSIENNTSNVTVKVDAWRTNTGYTTSGNGTCYCTINGTKYSATITNNQKITYNSHTVLFSKTLNISHNADGTKKLTTSAYINHDRFKSSSQGFNVNLTNIPRQANILTAPDFTNEQNPTITYNNPAGETVETLQACISLDGSADTIAYRDLNKLETSYTFELTSSDVNTLLNATPNSNTLAVYFIIKTVIGGNTYYSQVEKTFNVVNANPVITGASYQDTNSDTTAITGDNTKIIQANSTAQFNFASITAQNGASLSSIAVTCNGVTVTDSLTGASVSNKALNFGTIDSASNVTAIARITDTRGNYTDVNISVTMLAWALPTAVISLKRKDNYYETTYIKVTANISSLSGNNSVTITYQYKETTASTYNSPVTIANDTEVTISIDNTKAYDFKFTITDRLGATIYNKVLQNGIPIIFFDRKRRAVGVGAIPDEDNELVVDRRINLKNTLQESIADLWTTDTAQAGRSGFLKFYDKDGNTRVNLTGYNAGYLYLYNFGGLYNYDDNNNVISSLSGSQLRLNANGNTKLFGWADNGYGVLQIFDASDDERIVLAGDTGRVTCDKISVSTPDNVSITKTGGNWAVNDSDLKRSGNVAHIKVVFNGNGSAVGNGANAFTGTLAGVLPVLPVFIPAYYTGRCFILKIDTNGDIIVRNTGESLTLASTNTITFGGTFIIND